jgi:creatinine amidohydrolase
MAKDDVSLARKRLPQVVEHVSGSARVLVPLGSTEQHGPHAPFGTDTILATELCNRIAGRVDALVAPAIPYGLSGDHEGFCGVPFLSVSTFSGIVRDLSASFSNAGMREIIFVNGHYTNVLAVQAALLEVTDVVPRGTLVYGFNYWDPLPAAQLDEFLSNRVGLHANIGETAALMAVDPSLVALEAAVAEYPNFPVEMTQPMVAAFFLSGKGRTFRATKSGVWGDPREATVELGHMYFDQLERACVSFIHGVTQTFEAFPERTQDL